MTDSMKFGPEWLRNMSNDGGGGSGGNAAAGSGGGGGGLGSGSGGGGAGNNNSSHHHHQSSHHHLNNHQHHSAYGAGSGGGANLTGGSGGGSASNNYGGSGVDNNHHHSHHNNNSSSSSNSYNNHSGGTNNHAGNNSGIAASAAATGPRYQLADFRYSREEMLSLFDTTIRLPEMLPKFKKLFVEKIAMPLALTPSTDDDVTQQRTLWPVRPPTTIGGLPPGSSNRAARGGGVGSLDRGGRGGGRGGSGGGRGAYHSMSGFQRSTSMFDDEAGGGLGGGSSGGMGGGTGGLGSGIGIGGRPGGVARVPWERYSADGGGSAEWGGGSGTSPRKEFMSRGSASSTQESWRRGGGNRQAADDDGGMASMNGGGGGAGGGWRGVGGTGSGGGYNKWNRSESWRDDDARANNDGPSSSATSRFMSSVSAANERGNSMHGGRRQTGWDEDNLPEWAIDDSLEGGGTFDSSGAFLDSSGSQRRKSSSSAAASAAVNGSALNSETAVASSSSETSSSANAKVAASNADATSATGDASAYDVDSSAAEPLKQSANAKSTTATSSTTTSVSSLSSSTSSSPSVPIAGAATAAGNDKAVKVPPIDTASLETPVAQNATKKASVAAELSTSTVETSGDGSASLADSASTPDETYVGGDVLCVTDSPAKHVNATKTTARIDSPANVVVSAETFSVDRMKAVADDMVEKLIMDDEFGLDTNVASTSVSASQHVQQQHSPVGTSASPAPVAPHQLNEFWFYRDPQDNIQGAFGAVEMAEWYRCGYFDENLHVRRMCDTVYAALGDLVRLCGGGIPFTSPHYIPPLQTIDLATVLKSMDAGKAPAFLSQSSNPSPQHQQQQQPQAQQQPIVQPAVQPLQQQQPIVPQQQQQHPNVSQIQQQPLQQPTPVHGAPAVPTVAAVQEMLALFNYQVRMAQKEYMMRQQVLLHHKLSTSDAWPLLTTEQQSAMIAQNMARISLPENILNPPMPAALIAALKAQQQHQQQQQQMQQQQQGMQQQQQQHQKNNHAKPTLFHHDPAVIGGGEPTGVKHLLQNVQQQHQQPAVQAMSASALHQQQQQQGGIVENDPIKSLLMQLTLQKQGGVLNADKNVAATGGIGWMGTTTPAQQQPAFLHHLQHQQHQQQQQQPAVSLWDLPLPTSIGSKDMKTESQIIEEQMSAHQQQYQVQQQQQQHMQAQLQFQQQLQVQQQQQQKLLQQQQQAAAASAAAHAVHSKEHEQQQQSVDKDDIELIADIWKQQQPGQAKQLQQQQQQQHQQQQQQQLQLQLQQQQQQQQQQILQQHQQQLNEQSKSRGEKKSDAVATANAPTLEENDKLTTISNTPSVGPWSSVGASGKKKSSDNQTVATGAAVTANKQAKTADNNTADTPSRKNNSPAEDGNKKRSKENKRAQQEEDRRRQLEDEKRRQQADEKKRLEDIAEQRRLKLQDGARAQVTASPQQQQQPGTVAAVPAVAAAVTVASASTAPSVAPWSNATADSGSVGTGHSLADIQKAERERRAEQYRIEQLLREQHQSQQLLAAEQQKENALKWNLKPQQVKSLAEIQAEEAKRQAAIERDHQIAMQLAATSAAGIAAAKKPETMAAAAATGGNSASASNFGSFGSSAFHWNNVPVLSTAGGNQSAAGAVGNSIWNAPKIWNAPTAASTLAAAVAAGGNGTSGGGFWEEPATKTVTIKSTVGLTSGSKLLKSQTVSNMQQAAAKSSAKQQQTTAKSVSAVGLAKASSSANVTGASSGAGAAAAKPQKSKKSGASGGGASGEESATNDFNNWCCKALSNFGANVDIPTFTSFLRDIDSPFEVKDYIRMYLGESKDCTEFGRQFLERRSKYKNQLRALNAHTDDLCQPAPAITPSSDFQEVKGKGKKDKKKNKMMKLDSRILGFSVTAAQDRLNVGDRDYGDAAP